MININRIKGSIPALLTPMTQEGEVDEKAFASFVHFQIESGSHGLVPMGTTGESPTLTHREHKRIIDICMEVSAGRVPVIPGTGSNSTKEAIELTRYAKDAGADACLSVVPYYNKPNQEGIYQHYKAIARAVDFPIIIYNIPGRCVVTVQNDTFKRLTEEMPHVFIGVKDATGEAENTRSLLSNVNNDFFSLCGDDSLFASFHKSGSVGCISVTANVAPSHCAHLHNAALRGDMVEFDRINRMLMPLHMALFAEPSPCPVKYAASRLGLIPCDSVRLPLVTVSQETREKVDVALKSAGLL